MSENTHQLGTYYKRMPDGKVREYPNLPANADWQQIYGQSGLSIEPPEDFEPEDEQSEEEAEEALLGATAQGPDTQAPDPEAEEALLGATAQGPDTQAPDPEAEEE